MAYDAQERMLIHQNKQHVKNGTLLSTKHSDDSIVNEEYANFLARYDEISKENDE